MHIYTYLNIKLHLLCSVGDFRMRYTQLGKYNTSNIFPIIRYNQLKYTFAPVTQKFVCVCLLGPLRKEEIFMKHPLLSRFWKFLDPFEWRNEQKQRINEWRCQGTWIYNLFMYLSCPNDKSFLAKIVTPQTSQQIDLMYVLFSVLILFQVYKRLKLFQVFISTSL